MNMFWLAQVGPHLWKNGINPESQEAASDWLLFSILIIGGFLLFFLMGNAVRKGESLPDGSFRSNFPRYRELPRPHRRRKVKSRPPSEPDTEADLTPELPQATVPPQDIPHVEAALKSNGDDCAPLARDTIEEKGNPETVDKN